MAIQNFFSGINTVKTEDDISDSDTTDSRNDDISQPGGLETRPGTAKNHTTAKANPPIMSLFSIATEAEVIIDMYVDDSGNLITF